MEELNKNQIVLLVLLVSFVTSIATGIVTVTLMDQTPPAVTQTINRIVERTIEKVVPGQPPPPIIKEVPVIITEEELILKVINGAAPGVVRIVSADTDKTFISSGFFVSTDGVIVASGVTVSAATSTTSYQAMLRDGRTLSITKFVPTLSATNTIMLSEFSFFKLTIPSAAEDKLPVLTFAKVLPSIGQTIVALGYSDRSDINVSVGIISSFLSTDASTPPFMMTNAASYENQGGPILNIKGEVIGLSKGAGLVVSSEVITTALTLFK